MSEIISMEGVSKWYSPAMQVLKSCTLQVARGEVVVIDGDFGVRVTAVMER